jgi:hypothetical protein
MFCQYCGTESTQGLNYCKRCGANLAPLAQEARPAPVQPGTAWAAGLTTLGVVVIGLGFIFPVTTELTAHGMNSTAVASIAFFIALTVFGCAALLLRFWSLLLGVGGRRAAARSLPGRASAAATAELGPSRFDALNPAAAQSVTEQTTRTLEHARKK